LGWREGSGPYRWMNYSEAIENVRYFGSALLKKIPIKNDIINVGFYMLNRFNLFFVS
jgi:long-subunit acyl-CoA synthetase (AMP-forming)